MGFLLDEQLCSMYSPELREIKDGKPRFSCKELEKLRKEMKATATQRRNVLQEREIEEHDWYLGLRLQHEVPLEEAAIDFACAPIVIEEKPTTHAARYSDAYTTRFRQANSYCNKKCNPLNCNARQGKDNYQGCPLTNAEIHRMLND
ncbi:hypothetical protein HYX12_00735 [Candidatus Woesearchaeota archaeon]|nr:hypothetical protein [Candidatus Woesearchaeota archaeon]